MVKVKVAIQFPLLLPLFVLGCLRIYLLAQTGVVFTPAARWLRVALALAAAAVGATF